MSKKNPFSETIMRHLWKEVLAVQMDKPYLAHLSMLEKRHVSKVTFLFLCTTLVNVAGEVDGKEIHLHYRAQKSGISVTFGDNIGRLPSPKNNMEAALVKMGKWLAKHVN